MLFRSESFKGVGPFQTILILSAIGFGAYLNAVFHPFVHDDIVFIQQNPNLAQWNHLSEIFTRSHAFPGPGGSNLYYRPFLDLLYKIQYLLLGLNPHGYHLFNVFLHIANSILIYVFCKFLLEKKSLACKETCSGLNSSNRPKSSNAQAPRRTVVAQ